MPNFTLPTVPYKYRGLRKGDSGWDVYALQCGINYFGTLQLTEDGVFGDDTHTKVKRFQKNRNLTVDGIAGVATQKAIAMGIGTDEREENRLPRGLLKGMFEKESGYLLGNHTAKYSDGSYDLGVSQINNKAKGVTLDEAFDPTFAINFMAKTIRSAYEAYSKPDPGRAARLAARGLPTPDEHRLWELAAGSWNRPAHTAYLAGEINANSAKPNAEQLEWIEGYISRVTTYMEL